jgi:hypothetical protein
VLKIGVRRVGTMPLTAQGGHPVYWTGRLFIQGPSKEDLGLMHAERGMETIEQRRLREEGPGVMLEPDEWAFYEDEEEVRSSFLFENVCWFVDAMIWIFILDRYVDELAQFKRDPGVCVEGCVEDVERLYHCWSAEEEECE